MPSEEFEISYHHIKSHTSQWLYTGRCGFKTFMPENIHYIKVSVPWSLTSDLAGLRESRETNVNLRFP